MLYTVLSTSLGLDGFVALPQKPLAPLWVARLAGPIVVTVNTLYPSVGTFFQAAQRLAGYLTLPAVVLQSCNT
jgi:hypothetical protein